MDDVDAVQAQIARNMLETGDWITARLNGIAYLEKSPLVYWTMAASFRLLGVRDWAARLPLALAVILLCWVTYRFGSWAFGERAGIYAGVALSTSLGLFLFTRILIPDAMLTLTITLAIWAWVRLLEPEKQPSLQWQFALGVSLGLGLLLKGLVAVVFPVAAALVYMAATSSLFSGEAWRRLRLEIVAAIALAIAAPWHVWASLANPPHFAFSMHSGPGEYRGFFWFYFFNEHLLRFLNLRYPRDYNTVPRLWFWLLNLVWLFPWSAYLVAAPGLTYRSDERAGRVRLMALCWTGVVMVFFTFSTTQEYYSMPIYPALALLVGSSMAAGRRQLQAANRLLFWVFCGLCAALMLTLGLVARTHPQGDISRALTQHPELYTLSLGHLRDLTLEAFAYLKLPLLLAALAAALAAVGLGFSSGKRERSAFVVAAGMILFFHSARLALVRFDPYLSSYPLAEALKKAPSGRLIEADAYYAFSSVFFYAHRTALLWNGRKDNLEYGSYAPGAPQVFLDDLEFSALWRQPSRCYLLTYGSELSRLNQLVGASRLFVVETSAANYLLTNLPLP
jgi:hypothetical protein